jgi:hypothetical protein
MVFLGSIARTPPTTWARIFVDYRAAVIAVHGESGAPYGTAVFSTTRNNVVVSEAAADSQYKLIFAVRPLGAAVTVRDFGRSLAEAPEIVAIIFLVVWSSVAEFIELGLIVSGRKPANAPETHDVRGH